MATGCCWRWRKSDLRAPGSLRRRAGSWSENRPSAARWPTATAKQAPPGRAGRAGGFPLPGAPPSRGSADDAVVEAGDPPGLDEVNRTSEHDLGARDELRRILTGMRWPARRGEIVSTACESGAAEALLELPRHLPEGGFDLLEAVWEVLGGQRELRAEPPGEATTEAVKTTEAAKELQRWPDGQERAPGVGDPTRGLFLQPSSLRRPPAAPTPWSWRERSPRCSGSALLCPWQCRRRSRAGPRGRSSSRPSR